MCHGISLWFWQGFEILTQGQSSSLIKKNFGIQSLQNWLHLLSLLFHTLLPLLPKGIFTESAHHVPGTILSPMIVLIY